MNALGRYHGIVYSIMRIVVGLLFAEHGGQKLLGFPPGGHGAGSGLMLLAGWIELVGGLLVAFGLFTRVAAFICSGEMAVAYFMAHAPGGVYPIVNHGEPAVIYCFVFLFIVFYGAGPWSIDALIWKTKTPSNTEPLRA